MSLNEPAEALQARLRDEVTGVQVVASEVNTGFANACNRAAERAQAPYLVLLNDDATVEPGWLEALLSTADAAPHAGAVGAHVRYADGTTQEEGAIIWADGNVTLLDQPMPGPTGDGVRRVDYASGVCLLVRRSSWEAVGGLDEGYFPAYYEDVDLSLKLTWAGEQVLVDPRAVVRHHQGSSTSLPYRTFLGGRNRHRLVARWAPLLARFEPPTDGGPTAIARAVRAMADRQTGPIGDQSAGLLPLVPDERLSRSVPERDLQVLRRELALRREYENDLERALAERTAAVKELASNAHARAQIECELEALRNRRALRAADRAGELLRRARLQFRMAVRRIADPAK